MWYGWGRLRTARLTPIEWDLQVRERAHRGRHEQVGLRIASPRQPGLGTLALNFIK